MKNAPLVEDWVHRLQPGGVAELLEYQPNTLFFAKDQELRLMNGNLAFIERCGFKKKSDIIGLTDHDIYPSELAENYRNDDLKVINSGKPLAGIVELFPNQLGETEWFLTNKVPLFDRQGEVAGLCGTIRSYEGVHAEVKPYLDLLPISKHLKEHFREPVQIDKLAQMAGMSVRQLQRRFRQTFQTTPQHYVIRLRLLRACTLLQETDLTVSQIANETGFYDHSAFSKKFSQQMKMGPTAYRKKHR